MLVKKKSFLKLVKIHFNRKYHLFLADNFSSANFVPWTRAWILSKAICLDVDLSSLNGENPQSSVVPNCSIGIYSAASKTRSHTSSGVSTRGLIGSITPTKTRWPGLSNSLISDNTRRRSGSDANCKKKFVKWRSNTAGRTKR